MSRSIFNELKFKMFNSGSRLNLFIGINIIVFFGLGILRTIEWLFTREIAVTTWIVDQLTVPAYLPELLYKPWTLLTYMFSHTGLLHFIFNVLWLYWMGRIFEDFLNSRQFTFTYIAGGLIGAILFLAFYNFLPAFREVILQSPALIGASAGVMAIVVATATLLPDYSIMLLFFGQVRLKYLVLIYVALDIIGISGLNPGGSIAHLGGALLGFIYIKQLQAGHDWSKIFSKRRKLKVVQRNTSSSYSSTSNIPDEEIIDRILDKISKSGYNSLTKQEKEQLFRASNKK